MTDNTAINIREIVLDMLIETNEKNQYSHLILSDVLDNYRYIDIKSRKFLTRLFVGTVENKLQLDVVINRYSNTKVNKMKPLIRNIMRMGVYQILYMDSVPDSAVCNESVKLAKKRGFYGLSGFVNGVLRNVARDKENIKFTSLSEIYSMPQWIIDEFGKSYDDETVKKILDGINEKRGLSVRCNISKISADEFYSNVEKQGIKVVRNPYIEEAALLSDFDSIEDIFGYFEGYFQVQDNSAMLAGIISDVKENDSVLDVCAAPGGKALQFADLLKGSGYVEARDISEYKAGLIQENISRSKMNNISAKCMDAVVYDEASEEKFDIVLADLPCSGLGVIGKKADIKYRITQEDIEQLSKLQRDILSVVWKYVKPGGTLIYSTCTISLQENEENVKWVLENLPFEAVAFDEKLIGFENADMAKNGCFQLLPGIHGGDGAFIAKFKRKA